jgi:hypothetical protein
MIIDPVRNGCIIWEGNQVQHINGIAQENIEKIISNITDLWDDGTRHERYYDLKVDVSGLGVVYGDVLNKKGIEFTEIKRGKIII